MIGTQHGIAVDGALVDKPGEAGQQQQCPDQDIGVGRQGLPQLAALEDTAPAPESALPGVAPAQQSQHRQAGNGHRDPLRQCRPQGDTLGSPTQQAREQDVQQHIETVEQQLQLQQPTALAKADEGTHQGIDSQRGRCAPDTNAKIRPGHRLDLGTALQKRQCQAGQRPLQQDHAQAQRRAYQQRPAQGGTYLGFIGGARRLGGEPGGAHAQEAETPVEKVEYHGAKGDCAQLAEITQVADDRRVHQPQQRRGGVGQDNGPGPLPDGEVAQGGFMGAQGFHREMIPRWPPLLTRLR